MSLDDENDPSRTDVRNSIQAMESTTRNLTEFVNKMNSDLSTSYDSPINKISVWGPYYHCSFWQCKWKDNWEYTGVGEISDSKWNSIVSGLQILKEKDPTNTLVDTYLNYFTEDNKKDYNAQLNIMQNKLALFKSSKGQDSEGVSYAHGNAIFGKRCIILGHFNMIKLYQLLRIHLWKQIKLYL